MVPDHSLAEFPLLGWHVLPSDGGEDDGSMIWRTLLQPLVEPAYAVVAINLDRMLVSYG